VQAIVNMVAAITMNELGDPGAILVAIEEPHPLMTHSMKNVRITSTGTQPSPLG
jgi:hypothetical protein